MSKQSKKNNGQPARASLPTEEAGAGASLSDFVIPNKVEAFCRCYKPVTSPTEMVEVFTDTKLRQFFNAWTCPIGDPLIEYLCMLRAQGFVMTADPATSEPAIVVTLRT